MEETKVSSEIPVKAFEDAETTNAEAIKVDAIFCSVI